MTPHARIDVAAPRTPRAGLPAARAPCHLGVVLTPPAPALDPTSAIAPAVVRALEDRVRALIEADRAAEALPVCEQLFAIDPDNPLTPHQLDALRGHTTAAAPRAYVVALFDGMAPRFDRLLVDTLEYRVPERLRAAVERVAPGRRFDAALDLGCGTGLTGVQLRPLVDVLHGIDLAPKMIAAAQRKGVYDELHLGELVDHLAETPVRYDLIVATDVLIYLGDLGPLVEAARGALTGGGLFACSIERHDGLDVRLAPTGRYQHSRGYVERLAADHDLDVLGFDPIEARLEAGRFVPAWLFVLRAGRGRSAARGRAPRGRSQPRGATR